ncbi:hypothetical protein COLO4_13743 [Corchorus olitorius]|uniref:Uncharacterized protein n=1 Tax=Corchorus olitorius TaxID=93759 RepID=A0A1R3JV34_9ROSI|nr:hypothetical protein COLO4_13743 [Corchorus olitorius]
MHMCHLGMRAGWDQRPANAEVANTNNCGNQSRLDNSLQECKLENKALAQCKRQGLPDREKVNKEQFKA